MTVHATATRHDTVGAIRALAADVMESGASVDPAHPLYRRLSVTHEALARAAVEGTTHV